MRNAGEEIAEPVPERDEEATVEREPTWAGAVWLDGRRLQRGFKRSSGLGPATYVSELAPALDAEARPDTLRILVERGADVVRRAPRSRFVEAPAGLGAGEWSTARQLLLGAWLTRQAPRAVHFVSQADAPALIGVPTILTVHDVVRHRYRRWYGPGLGSGSLSASAARTSERITRAIERHAIARARRIIVPSLVTAEELIAALAVPRGRIAIIPEAPSPRLRAAPVDSDAAVRRRLRLPERYLLHPGGAVPRKRLPELVRVFDDLARRDPTLGLVLVGPVEGGEGAPELKRAIAAASAAERIRLAGVLDDDDLAAVYRGARAVVLASRHEGFGLPVVEAFACGVPVIATAAPAIAEAAGGAAMLVPVDDVSSLADAVHRVLGDPSLAQSLRMRGLARAAQFRWSVAAAETLSVYEDVLGEPLGVRSR